MNLKKSHYVPLEDLGKVLKKSGLKLTPQRLAVHRAMLRLGHASADGVARDIREEGGTKVTAASVYNILSQLSQAGVYTRCMSADSKMYFDVNIAQHLHLYDTQHDTFTDVFDDELLEAVKAQVCNRRVKGYKIDGVEIQILCHPRTRSRKGRKA